MTKTDSIRHSKLITIIAIVLVEESNFGESKAFEYMRYDHKLQNQKNEITALLLR